MLKDTLHYINRLHDAGHPPVGWAIELCIKRPRALDFERAEREPSPYEWILEVN
jgi:hypothetical protein